MTINIAKNISAKAWQAAQLKLLCLATAAGPSTHPTR